mgnify:CR=1 FL=1
MAGKSYLHDTDVDEWRYVCPSCGSHTIVIRQRRGWPQEHSDVSGEFLDGVVGHVHDFKCQSCGSENDVLYDKKERETVQKHQLDL